MDSISRANGGIFEAEKSLQQTLQAQMGVAVQVVGLHDSHTESDRETWSPLIPTVCAVKGPPSFGYSPDLVDVLLKAQADLGYFVGLWKYPSVASLRWSRATRKPFMVAPHGMLDPWAVRNSGAKKRVAAWLFQNAQLRKATCIRALCLAEAKSIRDYGLKNPICIIPNGIDLPTIAAEKPGADSPIPPDRKVLLYLGRLHPKKGLANLINAWSKAQENQGKEWVLAIAGWDQGDHEAELKQQVTDLGFPWGDTLAQFSTDQSIFFLGPQFGAAKQKIYSRCDAFILPSFSEGLPMVILEAWAYGKPVLMTPECNLPEGFAARAALRIEPTVDSIAEGLDQLFKMSSGEQLMMGKLGLELVKDRFDWSKIALQMKSVYAWMLGDGARPECVIE
jgi:glycosyltransferase involved in cell wall biosynthesis